MKLKEKEFLLYLEPENMAIYPVKMVNNEDVGLKKGDNVCYTKHSLQIAVKQLKKEMDEYVKEVLQLRKESESNILKSYNSGRVKACADILLMIHKEFGLEGNK